ncbi:site-specific DNA-methyltransferase [Halomonas sp. MES3-P3E]|uniref:site-specific DNA-methyltransferase n=1 Tax=Halomonas sp. MES3-P3E TaxID=2058321 RepID=UPI0012FE823E|nr:site-specific DNA-methyltransferase [Halomonas sp. MES3-P3E]
MTAPTPAFDELRRFLKDMFQFEAHDLDFGIYRITRLKRQFIQTFIDGKADSSLQSIVSNALNSVHNSQSETASNWLAAFAAQFGDMGRPLWQAVTENPEDETAQARFRSLFAMPVLSDEQREQAEAQLTTFLETRQLTSEQLETKVYNHLLNFFELYYQNGDFGYNTRATSAFKVPYEADYDGTDTLFHWKHKDSYYIKTGNGFHSVRCQIAGEWVEFRLVSGGDEDVETSERNNNKDGDSKHYQLKDIQPIVEQDAEGNEKTVWQVRFTLAARSTPKIELYTYLWQEVFQKEDDLTPYLYKKPDKSDPKLGKPLFNDLTSDFDKSDGGQIKGIGQLRLKFEKYLEELAKRNEFADLGGNVDERRKELEQDWIATSLWEIDRNLNKFYVGNDADYFIHKNLQEFLTGEKSRFIKQVIFSDLDALLHAGEDNSTALIARAFNQVADTLIGFLAAIENFQKGLFELKKKIVDTHYLVSVGKIPSHFHKRVFANMAQRDEWRDIFKVNISNASELIEHPTLVVDTSLFRASDPNFQDDLISLPEFDNLDEQTDGLLIASENWQALNLLQEKFREQIKCIYIDPPYNTGGDGFLYKDSFRHSSWASMIHDRLMLAHSFLSKHGVLFASIDEKERTQLENQLRQTFGASNRVEEIIWAQNSNKNKSPTYSTNHEYVEVFAKDLETVKAEPTMFREPKPGYAEMMELVEQLNSQYLSSNEFEAEIIKLYANHREALKAELETQGIEFDKNLDPWKGLYNYKNAEYRDVNGYYVEEHLAQEQEALIWIWRESDASMPQVKQDSQKAIFRDPSDPAFRFYKPIHPVTKKPCPHPKRGWAWPFERMEGQTSCFVELDADKRIVWGKDEKKVPQVKRYLHEAESNVAKSVVTDYSDGEKDLTATTGKTRTFASPKPVNLIERFTQQTTSSGEWVMDFFAGSGTTGHAVIRSDEQRRFLLTEMGGYFDSILKPRIKRVLYSTQWKDGAPINRGLHKRLVKVQSIEQYEDLLDNLTLDDGGQLRTHWDEVELPKQVPVSYLFRPEQSSPTSSLDISRPFSQTLRVGKAREEKTIDLMETWCYLQGYWVKSRRTYRPDTHPDIGRPYLVVETIHDTLVVFRDINPAEDDTDSLHTILAHYTDEQGVSRVQRLELNFDADLRQLTFETYLIQASDFLRGAQWS